MSQTTQPPFPGGQPQMPPLLVNGQFVKDLSFEVPGAPQIYANLRGTPQVNVNLDVQVQPLSQTPRVYEVGIAVRVEAREPSQSQNGEPPQPAAEARVVFIAEFIYAGVFTLNNVPDNMVEPILMVECPRLLFPYARNLLADITREGGFPPLVLQPVDFVALWQMRRAQAAEATAGPVAHA
ncbi:MAG: protein-export chaperone SecB [Acidobacteriia bacterium]|nr:protein-export chaperone SecB [Methyloceanibacter sp.]MBX5472512.1 protein-export chaperone SecB [Acetobacteraceae bacterium]MCL6491456.1 protein-export chaperone SecB [Terriglobia bacterium]